MSRSTVESVIERLLPAESRWFLYLLLGGIAFALLWRFVVAPRRRTVVDPALTPVELACLRSRQAPVVVALAQLRAGGHVSSEREPTGPPLPPGTDPFVRSVYTRCGGSASFTVHELTEGLSDELDALEHRLAARGYLRSETDRWRMRLGAAPVTACAVGGAIGVLFLAVQGREGVALVPGVLLPSLVIVIIVAPWLWSVDRGTRAGWKLFDAERERLDYLAPSRRPAWATYGGAAVGLSVAVFGTAALWQFDDGFAGAVELAGSAEAVGDGGGSCGGSSCGGGGGCGGGGCGGCGGCGG